MMRRIASIVLVLAVSLWLGGVVALFLFVQTLFLHNRPVAVNAAPLLFLCYERYSFILAAVTIAAALGMRLAVSSARVTVLLTVLIFGAFAAILSHIFITSPMEALRVAGRSSTPGFMRLHGYSMVAYCIQAGLLVVSACVLPGVFRDSKNEDQKRAITGPQLPDTAPRTVRG